jgi:hypothetical protein
MQIGKAIPPYLLILVRFVRKPQGAVRTNCASPAWGGEGRAMNSPSLSNMAKFMMRRLRSPESKKVEDYKYPGRPDLNYDRLFGDLDEEALEMVKSGGLPFLFSVVSWGCAATEWLAKTLNSHPDIFCLHHADITWNKIGRAPQLSGWEYLRVVGVTGWSYRASGDVHGLSLEAIPDLRAKLGDAFNCAILVREPLPRLRSQIALFDSWPVKADWNVDYVQRFIDEGIQLPQDNIDNRLFLHGVNMLNTVIQEEPVAPIWRFEDLTTSPKAFARFVEELMRGRVEVELEWAERAVRRPTSNPHRGTNAAPRPFEPWQMEAIRKVVEPRAWEIYERLGYKTPDFVELTRAADRPRTGMN